MRYKFSKKGFAGMLLVATLLFLTGASFGSAIVAALATALYVLTALLKPWLPFMNGMHREGKHTAGISQEIWVNDIQENLFPTNEFLTGMIDMSEYVNKKTVHIPQSGTAPNVVKNRSKGGAAVSTNLRTDTLQDFSIDEYTSDPFLITNVDEVELSYDKRASVLYEMNMKLRQVVGDNILISIAPTGTALLPDGATTNVNVLRSTGITNNDPADVRSSLAYTPAATGNRLNFTLYDLKAAKKMLDKQNVPSEDRLMIMSPDAIDQIVNDLIVTKYRQDAMNIFDTKTGKVDTLLGFKICMRSQVCQYSNAATPVVKAYGAAGAVDDNDAILFFQKAFVARAIGDIHVYETLNSAVHYGDVYSALIRIGASKIRSSELGLGAIVQKASV